MGARLEEMTYVQGEKFQVVKKAREDGQGTAEREVGRSRQGPRHMQGECASPQGGP